MLLEDSDCGRNGYVGLTTAVCLANKGHDVFCVGRNPDKIERLWRGTPIICEEKLEELLKNVLKNGAFVPTTDLKKAVHASDISFICVGTPCGEDGSINLTQIKGASKGIGDALKDVFGYHVVVKSTVVPGTTEDVVLPILEKYSGKRVGPDFGVCMNPEFLREGRAINDFMFPKETGVVIGEFDQKSGDLTSKIYEEFNGVR